MKLRLMVAILALLPAGCIRHTEVTHTAPAPKAATPASTPTVWDRQIKNAQDAGDGDYQLRALRDKIAAEPDNIPARLELAKAYRERGYPDVALEICRLAADRFPDSAEPQLALATALRDMNAAARRAPDWTPSSRPTRKPVLSTTRGWASCGTSPASGKRPNPFTGKRSNCARRRPTCTTTSAITC